MVVGEDDDNSVRSEYRVHRSGKAKTFIADELPIPHQPAKQFNAVLTYNVVSFAFTARQPLGET